MAAQQHPCEFLPYLSSYSAA